MSESVLVIQNNILSPYLLDQTGRLITEHKDQIFTKILDNQTFMQRDEAEYNFEHKQVIPYVIVRNSENYLLLQRTANQTEKRLHNKYSLGIGGHINPEPVSGEDNIILSGLYRELNEEVLINEHAGLNFIGVINDERNSVSKVHLGMLYVLEALSPDYQVLETDNMTARWIASGNLKEYYDQMETWSQIVYDYYIN